MHHRVHRGEYVPADRAPFDEVVTPDSEIERCETHDVLYRVGGSCLCCEREAADD